MTAADRDRTEPAPPSTDAGSLAPFRYPAFAVLWTATVISNVGTWMQSAGAGWLMTTLDPDPFTVSLVQVATSLPMFIFAIPAGALADIVDRRRLLIAMQCTSVVLVAGFALLVEWNRVTPGVILTFSFLSAATAALIWPAWQSIVQLLVPRRHLRSAVALNSVGLNISRAIGPALSGIIIVAWGLAAPFWVNAFATLWVIAGLVWWHPPKDERSSDLPPEEFNRAIRAGFRHVRYNPYLRATLVRSAGFFVFASAYWALLPLLSRDQVAGGPTLYGILLGAIGVGAVAGAFALPWLNRHVGADRVVIAGTAGTAVALLLFALARQPASALAASVIAGVSWIAVLATINVAAQVALPSWVRGRGLSIYITVMTGSLTLGSAIWGKVAALTSLPVAHGVAAAGALLAAVLLGRWKLQTAAEVDLTPSMHWPEPALLVGVETERGPVLITVEYQIRLDDRAAFLQAIAKLAGERRRDGAFEWDIFEDASQPGRFVEIFMLDSWIEHLRQHERVTHADRELQETVNRFNIDGSPKVSHFISGSVRH
jgi:MFS family permease